MINLGRARLKVSPVKFQSLRACWIIGWTENEQRRICLLPWMALPMNNSVLSRAVAPHLFIGQSPLPESSVTFGACVHSRTPKSAQQLASWSAVSTSKCKAASHAWASASFACNWRSELNRDPRPWLMMHLRYSYQQGTSSAWPIMLGRGVTVS